MTEPLTAAQQDADRLAEPAGPGRHGQPVPLLPAHRRRPDPVRRLRRDLPLRPAGASRATRTARRRYRRLAAHFFDDVPAAGGHPVHATAGPARSTPAPGSARSTASPGAAGSPTRPASPGWGSGPPASPPTSCSTCSPASRPSAPRWRWCGASPCPFPPGAGGVGSASSSTRWSLDRADHREGHRNLCLAHPGPPGPGLRLLTPPRPASPPLAHNFAGRRTGSSLCAGR